MTDLSIDNDGNIDLSVIPSTLQHQRDVVLAYKGHHRFFPIVGVGVESYLNDETPNFGLSLSVRAECRRVDLPPANVQVSGPTITLLT